jgi:hypothetical protein
LIHPQQAELVHQPRHTGQEGRAGKRKKHNGMARVFQSLQRAPDGLVRIARRRGERVDDFITIGDGFDEFAQWCAGILRIARNDLQDGNIFSIFEKVILQQPLQ